MFLAVAGIVLLVVVWFVLLRPRDEPKYQGRYLSEWMQIIQVALASVSTNRDERLLATEAEKFDEAQRAVLAIGSNAVPCLVKWIRESPLDTQPALYAKSPSWIRRNRTVRRWLLDPAFARFDYGCNGLRILGTNAVSAVPELNAMMRDSTKPRTAGWATRLVRYAGAEAILPLKTAFADPNQVERSQIVFNLGQLVQAGHTNTCLPTIIEALNDKEGSVRGEATNVLLELDPHFFTNTSS